MASASKLIRVDIQREWNADGERVYLVTPTYCRNGRTMTVPDDKGWPTRAEAIAAAERLCGVPTGTIN